MKDPRLERAACRIYTPTLPSPAGGWVCGVIDGGALAVRAFTTAHRAPCSLRDQPRSLLRRRLATV